MRNMEPILAKLPEQVSTLIAALPQELREAMTEIRIIAGQPLRILADGREYFLEHRADGKELKAILNNILDYSYYAYEEELAKGYMTIEGGHRIGICGRGVVKGGQIRLLKDISSLNIRCTKEVKGAGDPLIGALLDSRGRMQNSLIVSPPGCGKTTLLRDMVRLLSAKGLKVGLCDERSEVAGMWNGMPAYDLGPRTDVLDGCPKAEGILMLLRSMGPDVIATDEIGKTEDASAVEAALCAGVGVLTTCHGNSRQDIENSGIGRILPVFRKIIFLTNRPSAGTVREILDA